MSQTAPWAVPAILSAAIGTWLILLGKSFWYDEAYSVEVADRPLGSILHLASTTEAGFSTGYYLLFHGWSDGLGLGYGPIAVRGLSLICGVAAVVLLWAITRRLYDERTATTAAALMSVSPFFGAYNSEGRQYTLLILASCLAAYGYLRVAEGSVIWILGYIAAGIVAIGARWFAVLVLTAILIAATAGWCSGDLPLKTLAALMAASSLAVLPSAGIALHSARSGTAFAGVGWIERPTWPIVRQTVGQLLGVDGTWLAAPALLLAILGLRNRRVALTAAWLVAPASIAFVASYLRPMFVPRYLLISLPPACIALAAGASSLGRRGSAAAMAALLTLSVVGVVKIAQQPPSENWEAVARELASRDYPVVLGWSTAVAPFRYYTEHHESPRPRAVIGGAFDGGAPALASRLDSLEQFWFVGTSSRLYVGQTDESRSVIEARHAAVERHLYVGRDMTISVTLYIGAHASRTKPLPDG